MNVEMKNKGPVCREDNASMWSECHRLCHWLESGSVISFYWTMCSLVWTSAVSCGGFRSLQIVLAARALVFLAAFVLKGRWGWASLVAQMVKNPPAMQEIWVRFLDWEDSLEKEMATLSSILAWRIPWNEEPGGLQSMGLQRVTHDWVMNTLVLKGRWGWLK